MSPRDLAALGFDLSSFGFGDLQTIAGRGDSRFRRPHSRFALIHAAVRQNTRLRERLGALVGISGLDEARLCRGDSAAGLGNGRLRAGEGRGILAKLRLESIRDKSGEGLSLDDTVPFVSEHLDDPQAINLGTHEDFLACNEGAGDEHGLHEARGLGPDHGDSERRSGIGLRIARLLPRRSLSVAARHHLRHLIGDR
jgi:hypothetical protein